MTTTTTSKQTLKAEPNVLFNQLPKLIDKGFLVLDVEPSKGNKDIFWLSISRYTDTGAREATFNLTDINATSQTDKQVAMAKILNKSWSNLAMPHESFTRKLTTFLHKRENQNLPLFVFDGKGCDLPLLSKYMPELKYQRVYDIRQIFNSFHHNEKGVINPSLNDLASILTTTNKVKQGVLHSPIRDCDLTARLVFNYAILAKYGI